MILVIIISGSILVMISGSILVKMSGIILAKLSGVILAIISGSTPGVNYYFQNIHELHICSLNFDKRLQLDLTAPLKDDALVNMPAMSVTLNTSHFEMTQLKDRAVWNIPTILMT